jgi:D-tyrosyl-tRNA(Tyr) deacylase
VEEQIIGVLKQHEAGRKVPDLTVRCSGNVGESLGRSVERKQPETCIR